MPSSQVRSSVAALALAVCSLSPAFADGIFTSEVTGDGPFTYSYTLSNPGDSGANIHGFSLAIFSDDDLIPSSITAPNLWRGSISTDPNVIASHWSFDPATDSTLQSDPSAYGGNPSSFINPYGILLYELDRRAVVNARRQASQLNRNAARNEARARSEDARARNLDRQAASYRGRARSLERSAERLEVQADQAWDAGDRDEARRLYRLAELRRRQAASYRARAEAAEAQAAARRARANALRERADADRARAAELIDATDGIDPGDELAGFGFESLYGPLNAPATVISDNGLNAFDPLTPNSPARISTQPEPMSLAIWGVVGLVSAGYGIRRRRRHATYVNLS